MKITYILLFIVVLCGACEKSIDDPIVDPPDDPGTEELITETFTFLSDGTATEGKIHLPYAYDTNNNLPTIYLIDFVEGGNYTLITDEFERVVEAVQEIQGFDALIVSLKTRPDIIANNPGDFQEYYEIFKNMTSYVDSNYTSNTSRTFIGRGYQAGLVLMTLFLEETEDSVFDNFIATDSPTVYNSTIINLIENEDFPQNKQNKKLHFSFTSTNDQESCNKMIISINEAQYPWLQFESKKYYGSTFDNTYPISYAEGIKFVFN